MALQVVVVDGQEPAAGLYRFDERRVVVNGPAAGADVVELSAEAGEGLATFVDEFAKVVLGDGRSRIASAVEGERSAARQLQFRPQSRLPAANLDVSHPQLSRIDGQTLETTVRLQFQGSVVVGRVADSHAEIR